MFSSIDRQGRYAYANQPRIAQWNLTRLAECLLPLIDSDENRAIELAGAELEQFIPCYQAAWLKRMRGKLGLLATQSQNSVDPEDGQDASDLGLIGDLLTALEQVEADYTHTFRTLGESLRPEFNQSDSILPKSPAFERWQLNWLARLEQQPGGRRAAAEQMRQHNPALIPRNHQIEAVIMAAYQGDFAAFEAMYRACCRPFADGPEQRPYMQPPAPGERVLQTFCGT